MKCKKDELIAIISGDCCGREYHGVYRALFDFEFNIDDLDVITLISMLIDCGFIEIYKVSTLYIYKNISCGIEIINDKALNSETT